MALTDVSSSLVRPFHLEENFNMVFQLPPSLTAKGPVRLEGIKREGVNENENSLSPYQA